MEEEIVVDDIVEEGNGEALEEDAQSTQLMPLLYIQQGKLRSTPQVSGSQTVIGPGGAHLAAIINPGNNQIVTSQNKIYIQGATQVTSTTTQNKQHIVIHRPVSTAVKSQPQKHIVLRKSNTTTAQIVPLSSPQGSKAQAGKHTFAYLGTLIKPNKSRESVVIPAGTLPSPQVTKSKLVIGPISQLAQTTTSSASGVKTYPSKHTTTKLLLPLAALPQKSARAKQGMFNVKINGQISTDTKGTITVLRESKTRNSTTHPPPLHPISQMSLAQAKKGNSNSTDSVKITENADSAVITPIHYTDEEAPPEKRRRTISNILRGNSEKRKKKQNLSKTPQDTMPVDVTPSSPESEQDKDKKSQNDEKKTQNDDDITLIKVVSNEDKKSNADPKAEDDINIEIIKTASNSGNESFAESNGDCKINNHNNDSKESFPHQNDPNFDPAKILEWKDGVGTLPGSTLKFRMNEFGMMEMVEEDDSNKQDKNKSSVDKENVCLTQNSSKASPPAVSGEKKNEERKSRTMAADTIYCCESCGCYGLAAEFESPNSCSPACTDMIEAKKLVLVRKEKDLKELRIKRKRKRLLQENQQLDEKPREKAKSETDEDTKDINITTNEEENQETTESKYPWQTGKLGFSWAKYLEHCKAKAAPVKLFKDAFPYTKNHFKVGMKLEAIDPEHPSHYCVVTVAEVMGYRVRLHFDGYQENYDFWVNADSMDILPVGWAEKNGHKLDPPKGYVVGNFSWNAYLRTCKATMASRTFFANKNSVFPTGFRAGMKLEAVDRKHSSLVCVASIAELMDSRILVHFDSWDEVYDYWADPSSPYIHPVGWCHHNGHSLTPPNNFKDPKSFTWDVYLRETQSVAAPARAFKQRPPCGFKRGMKLEAVDKRVPQLIRVATVEDVKDHMLKIRFDGWPENHAYWVDDDSTDIHPMGWCLKTGHPLEPPLTPDNLIDRPECGTHGCRGIGHVKGPKYATHNSASGCPYSPQNLQKSKPLPDRLNVKHESCEFEEELPERPKLERVEKIKMERTEKIDKFDKIPLLEDKTIKTERGIKIEDSELSDKNEKSEPLERSGKWRHQHSDGQTDDDEVCKKRRKRQQIFEEPTPSPTASFADSILTSVPYAANIPDKQLRTELYHSVYNPGYNPLPDAPHIWAKHSSALNRVVARQNTNPRRWSNEEVIKFIQSVPNCREIGSIFRKHGIDGESFLMLTQEDLVSLLGLRLGPAIKLYNSIVLLRRRAA